MSKTNKRRVFAEPQVFSAQEFEASGIRELSFEELLEVNGGKQVKDDPRTDKNSDTCPHSSNTPRESSSSGSGSSGGSSGGGASSGSSVSSGSLSSSGSSGSYSSESSGASNVSGGSSTSGGSNKEEERSPTQGGGAPHAEISSPSGGSSSGAESAGTNTGSSGSSSAGGSSGGGSFDRDSPERDRDSDRDSGSWSDSYTPSGQSRESPKPNKGEEKSPTQGGGAPRGEAATTGRNHGKNTGAINSGTKGGVLSGFKEFWGNAGNVLKDTTGKIRDKFEGAKETNGGKKVNNELWDTAGSYITSPTWRTGKNVEAAVIHHDEFMDEYMNIRSPKELNKQFADICKTFIGGKYLLGGTVPSTEGGEGIDCSEMPLIGLRRVSGKDITDRTANDILKDPELVIDSKKWGDQNFVVDDRAGCLTGFDWRPNGEFEGNGRFDHITVNIEGGLEIHPSSVSETIKLIPSGSIDRFASTIVHKEFNWRYILGKNKL